MINYIVQWSVLVWSFFQVRPDSGHSGTDESAMLKSRIHFAPERLLDEDKPVTRAGDVYGFSLILYEIFSLKPAYKDELSNRSIRVRYTVKYLI